MVAWDLSESGKKSGTWQVLVGQLERQKDVNLGKDTWAVDVTARPG